VEYPYEAVSRVAVVFYFSYLLIIIPALSYFEHKVLSL
jgi:hypothetical protein